MTHEDLVVSWGGICNGKKLWHVCGLFTDACTCTCICGLFLRLHLCLYLHLHWVYTGLHVSAGFYCVCTCVTFVFTPALHLHLHWRCHGCLLCSRVCTWVAPVLECLVPSEFRKETLKNPHLLWHLLAVVCVGRCWFRLRLWFPPAIALLGTASL